MAKSNCPAEDSAPPQASAGQLTPRFLPLSLSGRLLQVTVAISPSAAKGASKGGRFSACIRSEGPRRQMQDFKRWVRGELLWRNRNFFQTEGDTDFRERVSRSIWPSKLVLSGYRILLAGGILSFGGEFFPIVCFCWLGKGFLWPGELPSRCVFKRCICWGTFRLEQNQKTAKRFFGTSFSAGIWVVEATSE